MVAVVGERTCSCSGSSVKVKTIVFVSSTTTMRSRLNLTPLTCGRNDMARPCKMRFDEHLSRAFGVTTVGGEGGSACVCAEEHAFAT